LAREKSSEPSASRLAVERAVYDLRGRLVRVLADEVMGTGRHEIPFDGSGLASGAYFYRLGCAVEIVADPKTAGFSGNPCIFCVVFPHLIKFLT